MLEQDPRVVASSDTQYSLLRIELKRGRAEFETLGVGGTRPLDSGSVSCRPLAD